jgi:CRP/FNR family cyclic AMP-dependent transcriptional regulator
MATSAEDTIARSPLFESLSGRERRSLAESLTERRYAAGHQISSEEVGGIGFFLIAEGTATVSVAGAVKGSLGPGDHFGEMALITGKTRSATVIADSDMVTYVLSRWHFKPLVMDHPEIAWALLEQLANRVRDNQV